MSWQCCATEHTPRTCCTCLLSATGVTTTRAHTKHTPRTKYDCTQPGCFLKAEIDAVNGKGGSRFAWLSAAQGAPGDAHAARAGAAASFPQPRTDQLFWQEEACHRAVPPSFCWFLLCVSRRCLYASRAAAGAQRGGGASPPAHPLQK